MEIASTLLEHGAESNAESKAGFTPLHLSAQKGHHNMTNLLIEHGADPNHKSKVDDKLFFCFFVFIKNRHYYFNDFIFYS